MKTSINKLVDLFRNVKSADHVSAEWDAKGYQLEDEGRASGMGRYPAMLVDANRSVALAEWNWMSMPGVSAVDGCAYMLSTRRI